MLSFLKSTSALESELRSWALENTIKATSNPDRKDLEKYYGEMDIKELAEEVASFTFSELKNNEMMMHMVGRSPGVKETWRLGQGFDLVKYLAKRKGWKFSCEGSPALGFKCTIS